MESNGDRPIALQQELTVARPSRPMAEEERPPRPPWCTAVITSRCASSLTSVLRAMTPSSTCACMHVKRRTDADADSDPAEGLCQGTARG